MRHLKKKKIGKGTDHRRKLLRALASQVILHEKIQTSYANARAIRPYVEKLITKGKVDDLHVRRVLMSRLTKNAALKTVEVLGPKYKERKGGYIRLTKLNNPHAGLSKVIVELID